MNEISSTTNDPNAFKKRNFSKKGGRPVQKFSRRHIVSARLSDDEMNLLDTELSQLRITRTEAVRMLLLHAVQNKRLPKRVYGGLTINSAEAYRKLAKLREYLEIVRNEYPKLLATRDVSEIFLKYNEAIEMLAQFVERIGEQVIASPEHEGNS